MSSRKLYSDAEESILIIHVAIVLNGIHSFVTEPDLSDRCITLDLDPISAAHRQEESVITRDLQEKLPGIFRGLIDLAAQALKVERSVEVPIKGRLADFSRWLAALEVAAKLEPTSLQQLYADNTKQAQLETIQGNPLGSEILIFAKKEDHWKGTPTELLTELVSTATASGDSTRRQSLPRSASALSKQLAALAAPLKHQGVDIEFSRGKERQITITDLEQYS